MILVVFCCSEEVAKELKTALSSIKLTERGVFVQASTLGSLEALLEFLKGSKIPVSFAIFCVLYDFVFLTGGLVM